MLTAENFRKIFDRENRKGLDLAGRFFPDLSPHTLAVHEVVKNIRELRSKVGLIPPNEFDQQLANLKEQLAERKTLKSKAVDKEMERLSEKATSPTFKIVLSAKSGLVEKEVYCIDKTPETFFTVKQLQQNIKKIYGVKQANRHDIVCRFRDILGSKFPFEVIRTDISSFYESIDRKKLLEKLDSDQILSPPSKRYIKQILDSYGSITKSTAGIPRGVGISAYLAELYLEPVDHCIRAIPGIVLYGRFVDDIIAVFVRSPNDFGSDSHLSQVTEILRDRGLTHSPKKTRSFFLPSTAKEKITYLGYRFCITGQKFEITPSAAKIRKYKSRLNAAFDEYNKQSSVNPRRAARTVVARIKFLTGNTRLSNSKSRAVTGVYYTNSLATDTSSFNLLDRLLKRKIETIRRPNLRARLKKFGFVEGFKARRFHNFSTIELHRVVEVWKHG